MNKKLKEGVTVQELENFGKKYHIEIFLAFYFVVATLLTFIFYGAGWSIFFGGIGAIVGIWIPKKVEKTFQSIFRYIFNQEKTTKIVLGAVGVVVAFFIPPLIFFFLGMAGGEALHKGATSGALPVKKEKKESSL